MTSDEGGDSVMVPFHFAKIRKREKEIRVNALYAHQFAKVPRLKSPDQITLLEEDKITAFYAGGELYADETRQEPFV
jgi:photosynthetic reaction center H subunit